MPEGVSADEGDDVTDALGIVLYEPPMPASDEARGPFPSFVPKTEEERVQNLHEIFAADRPAGPLVVTEKLDGSSLSARRKSRGIRGPVQREPYVRTRKALDQAGRQYIAVGPARRPSS